MVSNNLENNLIITNATKSYRHKVAIETMRELYNPTERGTTLRHFV